MTFRAVYIEIPFHVKFSSIAADDDAFFLVEESY